MKPAFTLHSPETNSEYVIYISEPDGAAGPDGWPIVMFMDGDDQFSTAVKAYRTAGQANLLPPLLLVGVGYGASYTKPGNRRGRDYTPTAHSDEPTSGGADAFMRFLRDTLWSELAQRYPVHNRIRGIAGHSLGSLLVLHALWQDQPFFTHHLASAPSIWWDDRSILRLASERHDRNHRLDAALFLSVGESDTHSMTSDFTLLEEQLRSRPFDGLNVTTRRFPARNHFNVLPDAFRAGLIALFGNRSESLDL